MKVEWLRKVGQLVLQGRLGGFVNRQIDGVEAQVVQRGDTALYRC